MVSHHPDVEDSRKLKHRRTAVAWRSDQSKLKAEEETKTDVLLSACLQAFNLAPNALLLPAPGI